MNIQEYISSGILEQYVLGLLEANEASEVERMATEHPEIRAEIYEIERALEEYALMQGIEPPKDVRSDILNSINKRQNNSTGTNTSGRSGWKTTSLLLLLASAVLAYLSFTYHQNTQDKQATIDQQQQQIDQIQSSCDSIRSEKDAMAKELQFLRNPGTRSIIMGGTDLAPEAIANVYFNEELQEAYLDVLNLPTPPANKQYQLWAIVEGNPVDMGVFDLPISAGQFTEVPYIANAQAFAVTLEDAGGVPSPTLSAMYVIGNT